MTDAVIPEEWIEAVAIAIYNADPAVGRVGWAFLSEEARIKVKTRKQARSALATVIPLVREGMETQLENAIKKVNDDAVRAEDEGEDMSAHSAYYIAGQFRKALEMVRSLPSPEPDPQ